MTGFETASLTNAAANAAAAVVAACGIWHGISAMVGANKDRAAVLDRQRQADERRHEETMAALAMQGRGLEALSASLERQTASLETVIERTAPTPEPAE